MPNFIRTKQIDQADLSGFFIDTIGSQSSLLFKYISGVTLNETVLLTGNQTISGIKTFAEGVNLNNINDLSLSGVNISIINGNVVLTNPVRAPNLVYNTGFQDISGSKTFKDNVSFAGQLEQTILLGLTTSTDNATRIGIPTGFSPTVSITRGGLSPVAHGYGIVFAGGPLGTKKGYLTSAGGGTTRIPTGYQYATLDWTNRILSGDWSCDKNIKVGDAYSVLTTGDQTISGIKTFNSAPIFSGNPLITGVNLSSYITTSQTGNFYAKSNPSGFITGISNIVYNTGNQIISGNKIFKDNIQIGDFQNAIFTDSDNTLIVSGYQSTLRTLKLIAAGGIYNTSITFGPGADGLVFNSPDYFFRDKRPEVRTLSPFSSRPVALLDEVVLNTGNQTISGVKTFANSGVFSLSGASALNVPNNPLSIVGSGNTYLQLNIQNRATGTDASADLVITANNGTDSTNYINLGINNSGYNNSAFTNGTGYDGYLFIDGGNLDIGTRTPGRIIEFHAGGTTQEKTIARISESGLNVVSGNLTVNNTGVLLQGQNSFILTLAHASDSTLNLGHNYFGNMFGAGTAALNSRKFNVLETCAARKFTWTNYVGTVGTAPGINATGYFINATKQITGTLTTALSNNSANTQQVVYGAISPPISISEGDEVAASIGYISGGVGTLPTAVRNNVNIYCYN